MLQSDGPGGAETMVLRLSEQLRSNGHTVVPVTIVGGIGWLGDQYRRIGFEPEAVRIGHSWVDRTFFRDLVRVIQTRRIELVHSHEFEMAVYGAAACRWLGIPHVFTMHGGLTVWKAWQRRVALRWAMRNSDASVVVSEATRVQFARELGVSGSRFQVVPNGVPIKLGDASRVRAEFGCQPGETVVLAVGNLERNKGHRELLEALARMDTSARPWRLIIAGGRGGPEHEFLRQYIGDKNLENRVHIATGRTDIPDLQALADVFVMPSLWEGMPMAVLEAMIAGKAIVASNTGGIPEAVTDGREGLLVPPGDVDALSGALDRLLSDPEYRRALGAAARDRGLREFTVGAMARRYEKIYESALNAS